MEISIGIPSYNEGINITKLLSQIMEEYRSYGTPIKEVIIVDDSTDETPDIIQRYIEGGRHPYKIKFIHNKERMGVANAWNTIFKESTGDIIVLYDADIELGEGTTITLANQLYTNKKLGIIGCRTEIYPQKVIPATASTIVSKWLHTIRKNHPESRFTIMGRALAIKTTIAKKIKIPLETISVDLYLQCAVASLGYNVDYVDRVKIYAKPPLTLKDFSLQIIRAYIGHKQLEKLVKKTLNKSDINIKTQLTFFIQQLRRAGLRDSLLTITTYLASIVYLPIVWRGAVKHLWEPAYTTK